MNDTRPEPELDRLAVLDQRCNELQRAAEESARALHVLHTTVNLQAQQIAALVRLNVALVNLIEKGLGFRVPPELVVLARSGGAPEPSLTVTIVPNGDGPVQFTRPAGDLCRCAGGAFGATAFVPAPPPIDPETNHCTGCGKLAL